MITIALLKNYLRRITRLLFIIEIIQSLAIELFKDKQKSFDFNNERYITNFLSTENEWAFICNFIKAALVDNLFDNSVIFKNVDKFLLLISWDIIKIKYTSEGGGPLV